MAVIVFVSAWSVVVRARSIGGMRFGCYDACTMQHVLDYLTANAIPYILHTHPAVFSTHEAAEHCKDIPGLMVKNLFLKNKKTGEFHLCILPAGKKLDFKKMDALLGAKGVTFGSAEELKEMLGLEPGSVSIFGVLNDPDGRVGILLDSEVYAAPIVTFHPNINTATLEITHDDLQRFLGLVKHQVQVVPL